jgi:hypothetical protein
MGSTVSVNMLTVVHAGSNGIGMAFPDVCKTPAPPAPFAPIPYPNIGKSSDTAQGTTSVKADGKSFMVKGANFKMSTGDEAGSMMGMVSNKIKGKMEPKMFSFDCKADGNNIMRLSDIMLANIGATPNTPPTPCLQPPMPAIPGIATVQAKDDPPPEITELKFTKTKVCCGDELDVEAKTSNFPDDTTLFLKIIIGDKEIPVDAELCPLIKGNEGKKTWRIRRGRYRKELKMKLKATGMGGPKDSSNECEIPIPDEAKQTVTGARSTPAFVEVNLPDGSTNWQANGTNYGWGYGYDIEIRKGDIYVTHKINFTGHVATLFQKYAWMREIQNVWDNKWKIHRVDCKRGDSCNCSLGNGCCVWPIRVKARYGSGHPDVVTLNAGANDPNGWGNGDWWYSNNWWEQGLGVPATVRAHEFGHLIGMYDEYPAGACAPGRAYANVPDSIMSSGSKVYERFMTEFKDWFDGKAGSVVGSTKLLTVTS